MDTGCGHGPMWVSGPICPGRVSLYDGPGPVADCHCQCSTVRAWQPQTLSHVTVTLRTWPPHAQAAAALRLATAPGVRRAYPARLNGQRGLRHAGWCGDHYAMINDHDHQCQCHGHTGMSVPVPGLAGPWASIRHHHDVRS